MGGMILRTLLFCLGTVLSAPTYDLPHLPQSINCPNSDIHVYVNNSAVDRKEYTFVDWNAANLQDCVEKCFGNHFCYSIRFDASITDKNCALYYFAAYNCSNQVLTKSSTIEYKGGSITLDCIRCPGRGDFVTSPPFSSIGDQTIVSETALLAHGKNIKGTATEITHNSEHDGKGHGETEGEENKDEQNDQVKKTEEETKGKTEVEGSGEGPKEHGAAPTTGEKAPETGEEGAESTTEGTLSREGTETGTGPSSEAGTTAQPEGAEGSTVAPEEGVSTSAPSDAISGVIGGGKGGVTEPSIESTTEQGGEETTVEGSGEGEATTQSIGEAVTESSGEEGTAASGAAGASTESPVEGSGEGGAGGHPVISAQEEGEGEHVEHNVETTTVWNGHTEQPRVCSGNLRFVPSSTVDLDTVQLLINTTKANSPAECAKICYEHNCGFAYYEPSTFDCQYMANTEDMVDATTCPSDFKDSKYQAEFRTDVASTMTCVVCAKDSEISTNPPALRPISSPRRGSYPACIISFQAAEGDHSSFPFYKSIQVKGLNECARHCFIGECSQSVYNPKTKECRLGSNPRDTCNNLPLIQKVAAPSEEVLLQCFRCIPEDTLAAKGTVSETTSYRVPEPPIPAESIDESATSANKEEKEPEVTTAAPTIESTTEAVTEATTESEETTTIAGIAGSTTHKEELEPEGTTVATTIESTTEPVTETTTESAETFTISGANKEEKESEVTTVAPTIESTTEVVTEVTTESEETSSIAGISGSSANREEKEPDVPTVATTIESTTEPATETTTKSAETTTIAGTGEEVALAPALPAGVTEAPEEEETTVATTESTTVEETTYGGVEVELEEASGEETATVGGEEGESTTSKGEIETATGKDHEGGAITTVEVEGSGMGREGAEEELGKEEAESTTAAGAAGEAEEGAASAATTPLAEGEKGAEATTVGGEATTVGGEEGATTQAAEGGSTVGPEPSEAPGEMSKAIEANDQPLILASEDLDFGKSCVIKFQAAPFDSRPSTHIAPFEKTFPVDSIELCATRCFQDGCSGAKYEPEPKMCHLSYDDKPVCDRSELQLRMKEVNGDMWIHCVNCYPEKSVVQDVLGTPLTKNVTGEEKPEEGKSMLEKVVGAVSSVAESVAEKVTGETHDNVLKHGCIVNFQTSPSSEKTTETVEYLPPFKTRYAHRCATKCFQEGCAAASFSPTTNECSLGYGPFVKCNNSPLLTTAMSLKETIVIHCMSCIHHKAGEGGVDLVVLSPDDARIHASESQDVPSEEVEGSGAVTPETAGAATTVAGGESNTAAAEAATTAESIEGGVETTVSGAEGSTVAGEEGSTVAGEETTTVAEGSGESTTGTTEGTTVSSEVAGGSLREEGSGVLEKEGKGRVAEIPLDSGVEIPAGVNLKEVEGEKKEGGEGEKKEEEKEGGEKKGEEKEGGEKKGEEKEGEGGKLFKPELPTGFSIDSGVGKVNVEGKEETAVEGTTTAPEGTTEAAGEGVSTSPAGEGTTISSAEGAGGTAVSPTKVEGGKATIIPVPSGEGSTVSPVEGTTVSPAEGTTVSPAEGASVAPTESTGETSTVEGISTGEEGATTAASSDQAASSAAPEPTTVSGGEGEVSTVAGEEPTTVGGAETTTHRTMHPSKEFEGVPLHPEEEEVTVESAETTTMVAGGEEGAGTVGGVEPTTVAEEESTTSKEAETTTEEGPAFVQAEEDEEEKEEELITADQKQREGHKPITTPKTTETATVGGEGVESAATTPATTGEELEAEKTTVSSGEEGKGTIAPAESTTEAGIESTTVEGEEATSDLQHREGIVEKALATAHPAQTTKEGEGAEATTAAAEGTAGESTVTPTEEGTLASTEGPVASTEGTVASTEGTVASTESAVSTTEGGMETGMAASIDEKTKEEQKGIDEEMAKKGEVVESGEKGEVTPTSTVPSPADLAKAIHREHGGAEFGQTGQRGSEEGVTEEAAMKGKEEGATVSPAEGATVSPTEQAGGSTVSPAESTGETSTVEGISTGVQESGEKGVSPLATSTPSPSESSTISTSEDLTPTSSVPSPADLAKEIHREHGGAEFGQTGQRGSEEVTGEGATKGEVKGNGEKGGPSTSTVPSPEDLAKAHREHEGSSAVFGETTPSHEGEGLAISKEETVESSTAGELAAESTSATAETTESEGSTVSSVESSTSLLSESTESPESSTSSSIESSSSPSEFSTSSVVETTDHEGVIEKALATENPTVTEKEGESHDVPSSSVPSPADLAKAIHREMGGAKFGQTGQRGSEEKEHGEEEEIHIKSSTSSSVESAVATGESLDGGVDRALAAIGEQSKTTTEPPVQAVKDLLDALTSGDLDRANIGKKGSGAEAGKIIKGAESSDGATPVNQKHDCSTGKLRFATFELVDLSTKFEADAIAFSLPHCARLCYEVGCTMAAYSRFPRPVCLMHFEEEKETYENRRCNDETNRTSYWSYSSLQQVVAIDCIQCEGQTFFEHDHTVDITTLHSIDDSIVTVPSPQGISKNCDGGRLEFQFVPAGSLPRLNVTNDVPARTPADCARKCHEMKGCTTAGFIPTPSAEIANGVCLLTSDDEVCISRDDAVPQHASVTAFVISCIRCTRCSYTLSHMTLSSFTAKFQHIATVATIGECAEICHGKKCTFAQYDATTNTCALSMEASLDTGCNKVEPAIAVKGSYPVRLECVQCRD